ncbi:MAG: hypothetical protein ABSE70_06175 [Candidatus Limnocylindrales bacterium]
MTVRQKIGRNGLVRPIDVIAVAGLVLGLWFVADAMGWIGPSLCQSPGPDDKPICDTVTAAIHAESEVPSSASFALARSQGLSSDAWVTAGTAKFAEYFTTDVLASKIGILRQDAEYYNGPDGPDALASSGGVRNIVVRAIAIAGDSATVTAQAETWSMGVSTVPSPWGRAASATFTTSSAETDLWSLHLASISGAWLIDREQVDRPPPYGGRGP